MRASASGVHGPRWSRPPLGSTLKPGASERAWVSYETFVSDLNAVRDRAGRYRRQAGDEERAEALVGALEELAGHGPTAGRTVAAR